MPITGGATENEICRIWAESLPTRSRQDTPQTTNEIELAYAVFAATCPDFIHLIPKGGTTI
ncbi:MAG: hypothetical protein OQK05_00160 [Pseudopelagicola sp.]|nr:hypothetical protein [Pseudopelagicola sp.]